LRDAIPDSDSDSDEGTVHAGTKFNPFEYIDRCTKRPLGRTRFKWAKVRTVSVAPQYDDDRKFTGNYALICSCGFPVRIGVVCRHILAVQVRHPLTIQRCMAKRKSDSICPVLSNTQSRFCPHLSLYAAHP
jgi:hypothetical protein